MVETSKTANTSASTFPQSDVQSGPDRAEPDVKPLAGLDSDSTEFTNLSNLSFTTISGGSRGDLRTYRPPSHPTTSTDNAEPAYHALRYAGAGRFWRPPDDNNSKDGRFRAWRRWSDRIQAADSGRFLQSFSPFLPVKRKKKNLDDHGGSASFDHPYERLAPDDERFSVSSEGSRGVSQHDGGTVDVGFRHHQKSLSDTSPWVPGSLAGRIAADERHTRTMELLEKLEVDEENRVLQLRINGDLLPGPTESTSLSRFNGPADETGADPSARLTDPPIITFEPLSPLLADLYSKSIFDFASAPQPAKPETVSHDSDVKEASCITEEETPEHESPKPPSHRTLDPPCLETLTSFQHSTQQGSPKKHVSDTPELPSRLPPRAISTTWELPAIHIPERSTPHTITQADSISSPQTQAQLEKDDSTSDSRTPELSPNPLSPNHQSTTPKIYSPSTPGGSTTTDFSLIPDTPSNLTSIEPETSLFSDLDTLISSLPARRHSPHPAMLSSTSPPPPPVPPQSASPPVELSSTKSVIHRPPLPRKPVSATHRPRRHHSDLTVYNTLPDEPFPIVDGKRDQRAGKIWEGGLSQQQMDFLDEMVRDGEGGAAGEGGVRVVGELRPDCDPRTGRPWGE